MKQRNNVTMVTMKQSFTLIELIIVIGIITLFSGLSLAAYSDFTETKKLEGETKKFVEVLELAKKKILSGDKSSLDENYVNCDLTGYKIDIISNTEYSLKAFVCQNNNGTCELSLIGCTDLDISRYKTLPEISISALEIVFYPFGLGLQEAKTVVIKNNNNAKCRQVNIEKSGVINEQIITCP